VRGERVVDRQIVNGHGRFIPACAGTPTQRGAEASILFVEKGQLDVLDGLSPRDESRNGIARQGRIPAEIRLEQSAVDADVKIEHAGAEFLLTNKTCTGAG